MIKRGVIIAIGTVFMVGGLTGLALLQTGVIYPPVSIGPVNLPEAKSPVTPQESGKQAPGPAGVPLQRPAPSTESGQGPSAQGGKQPPSADLGTPRPITAPQAGKNESRHPGQDRVERPRTTPRSAEIDRNRRQAPAKSRPERFAGKSESKRHASKSESKRYAHKSESKRYAAKSGSKHYAGRATPSHTTKPVVIRINFDPARNRRLDVAQVHLGDKIRVKVQQVGHVEPAGLFDLFEESRFTAGRRFNA